MLTTPYSGYSGSQDPFANKKPNWRFLLDGNCPKCGRWLETESSGSVHCSGMEKVPTCHFRMNGESLIKLKAKLIKGG